MTFARSMSNKYGKRLVDTAKKSATDAIKLLLKEQHKKLQKQLVTWQVIKLLKKITSISKKSTKKLPTINEDAELTTHKERYISTEEKQQIIDELRLIPKN